MQNNDEPLLNERERLLVLAAYLHGTPPGGPVYANCAKVLCQALLWAELWSDEVEHDALGDFENPIIEDWYSTLIGMTRFQPEARRLIDGWGNLKLPTFPSYTACGLTERGWALAERLFEAFPQYHENAVEFLHGPWPKPSPKKR